MSLPKTFEVVFKTEAVADDLQGAVAQAKKRIADGATADSVMRYGIIRDDNLFEGRTDTISRYTNHVVVLDPQERQELQNIVHKLGASSPLPEAERFRLLQRAVNLLDWKGEA